MAEGLLRRALEERGCADVEVASAGTWAGNGARATPETIAVLRQRGIDLGSYRSRALGPAQVEEADVIVAMTSVHVREILDLATDAGPKIVLLKGLPEMQTFPSRGSRAERLQAFLAGPRPEWHRAMDVDDPIGLPFGAYERCVQEIENGVRVLADVLCGRET